MLQRVFISYSHQDRALAEKICSAITNLGLEPFWDERFAYGKGFHDQIKRFIAHSHIFLPIITESSSQRGWVHQEIGFAVALNIPVLPVAWGQLPAEMLHELHAIMLPDAESHHEEKLNQELTLNSINTLIAGYSDEKYATYETAPLSEDRTLLMTRYANQVQEMGKTAILRQKGGLSSMHIPKQVITHPEWKERYGDKPKGDYHYRCQLSERKALEYHAVNAGFKLIIDPYMSFELYGPKARKARLKTLIDFLSSLDNDPKYQVAFCREGDLRGSITILDDWFYAESVSPSLGSGYRQTIFTQLTSMQTKIDLFDHEFNELLTVQNWQPENSKKQALNILREITDKITC